jgi:hypothetical protein
VSSHRFLCSLPQNCGLELPSLTPSGILHIVAIVTLCEAFMGIDPHFDLWNHFFCVQWLQGSGAEMMVSGGMVIHVKSGHDVNPYFDILIPRSMNAWQKMWFYRRNDAATPLLVFTGNCPTPNLIGGTRWPRRTSASYNLCARSSNSCGRRG